MSLRASGIMRGCSLRERMLLLCRFGILLCKSLRDDEGYAEWMFGLDFWGFLAPLDCLTPPTSFYLFIFVISFFGHCFVSPIFLAWLIVPAISILTSVSIPKVLARSQCLPHVRGTLSLLRNSYSTVTVTNYCINQILYSRILNVIVNN